MPHVDEGTLHAYLDGELPSAERTTLETHLAECASCRAMLAEERALLERASAVLGATRPAERPAPPFEQLSRSRAPKRSPWHVRTPVAWAASIALALGLGYYLRDSDNGRPVSGLVERRAAPVVETAQNQEPATADKAAAPTRQSSRPRALAERAADVAHATESAGVDSLRRSEASSGFVALQPQAYLRDAAPALAAAERSVDSVLRRRDSVPALDEVVVTAAPAAAERRADSRAARNVLATAWPVISRGAAASLLGDKPVGVPGLATRRIRRSPGADSTVVVEQALDSSTLIQIFQRPATARFYDSARHPVEGYQYSREPAPAAAPAPADRLARFVGKLRVEISGPLSIDSLNKLLEQVQPLP